MKQIFEDPSQVPTSAERRRNSNRLEQFAWCIGLICLGSMSFVSLFSGIGGLYFFTKLVHRFTVPSYDNEKSVLVPGVIIGHRELIENRHETTFATVSYRVLLDGKTSFLVVEILCKKEMEELAYAAYCESCRNDTEGPTTPSDRVSLIHPDLCQEVGETIMLRVLRGKPTSGVPVSLIKFIKPESNWVLARWCVLTVLYYGLAIHSGWFVLFGMVFDYDARFFGICIIIPIVFQVVGTLLLLRPMLKLEDQEYKASGLRPFEEAAQVTGADVDHWFDGKPLLSIDKATHVPKGLQSDEQTEISEGEDEDSQEELQMLV